MFEAAAYLHHHAGSAVGADGQEPLGWLLPVRPFPSPPAACPCCGAPSRGRDARFHHYACGCLLLWLRDEGGAPLGWVGCLPCQQPGFGPLLEAVATLPDNPLEAGQRRVLLELLGEGSSR